MKRTLAIALAAIMLAASLAGCAGAPTLTQSAAISPKITLTSSDGENAAEWLTARLGDKLTDRVVLGTDADGYGVDVAALEEDGYIIRALGDKVALFAQTAVGLDCAVRRYAKTVERGDAAEDETYHEGVRVESLTIAGVDIGEFSVFVEDDEFSGRWVRDRVAPTFAALVKAACGREITLGDESAAHRVVFRLVDDPDWHESDFRYFVSDGDLIFEYSMKLGAKYGMVAFFEEELGWRDLDFGYDFLPESDAVDVPADRDYAVKPLFSRGYDARDNGYVGNTGRNTLARTDRFLYNFRSQIPKSGHGMSTYKWYAADASCNPWYQICYTNETLYASILDMIYTYITDKLDAGEVIGDTLTYIDCGQSDNLNYCKCKNCLLVMAQENNSEAGPVIRWINRLEEDLDAEGFDGLIYTVFAYHGSNKPSKTAPNDDVYVTFCLDGSCSRHLLDGSQCQGMSFDMAGAWGPDVRLNNRDFIGWIRGWGELTDNLYVWYYGLDNNFYSYNIIDILYDDLKLLSELNVAQVHMESESCGLGFSFMFNELGMRYTLHPDMTREEFSDAYCEVLELTYGDGWRNVYEAIAFLDECELRVDACRNCWAFSVYCSYENMDCAYYLTRWDEMCELFDKAIADANTPWQVGMCERMSTHFIYNGIYGAYFPAYEADDAEMTAKLEERWAIMCERLRNNGVDEYDDTATPFDPDCDMHEFAWAKWAWTRAEFFPEGTELKPAPAE